MTARAGDRIVMIGPCGGGYGDPMARDPAQVLEDVRDGLISVETAQRDYGVAITDSMTVDAAATGTARQAGQAGQEGNPS